ncbi:right-handed parallel beta-helix repeat-containing protein [Candidatus Bathyarchaeota archaeon]|nr:right-handed parallel beta-helix repeat-containing protein [Candidatus Bathyarchaeota archaeon]
MTKSHFISFLMILCLYSAMWTCRGYELTVKASPRTLIVGDDGFDSIQEAINSADIGDIVFVRRGEYYENILVNKSITLIGEDREHTIIDGNMAGNVISIETGNVKISGFTVRNSSLSMGCGVFIERAGNITISNNRIMNTQMGIQMFSCSGNYIYENVICANYIAIQLLYSGGNFIYRNEISKNTDGIDIYYSFSNMIYENTISSNFFGAYIFLYSNDNVFYHNNFEQNNYQVYTERVTNIWFYNNEGNYWSDYKGYDLNADGIGDIPYNVTETDRDHYPLMGAFHVFTVYFKENIDYITIISNSTITNLTFTNVAELKTKTIFFNAVSNDSAGFSRIFIPRDLMENVSTILINDEEVYVSLLNITDEKKICIYLTYPKNCSVKIVYSELLDLYYQLVAEYLNLINKFDNLNGSYSNLLKEYLILNETLIALNVGNDVIREQLYALNETLHALNETLCDLLKSYNELQVEFGETNSAYKEQKQNLESLMYMFAAVTAVLIVMTIYLSKKVHERSVKLSEG